MKTRRQQYTLLAALLLAAPACASMQQRVTASENRSATLEAQVADLQATQQNIIERLTQLRQDLEAALDPVRAQQAGGGADLRGLQQQVASLQQQVQLLTDQLAAVDARADAAFPMPPAGDPDSGGGAAADDVETAGGPPASDADALFNAAYRDYTTGEYIVAISGFEEFVARYPDSARAPDAIYWVAESLAAQDQHDDARVRFLEISDRYPNATKVPDALLRAALEAVELGRIDDATMELRALIDAHPRSDAALIGCMQLDRLGLPLPGGCG